ncbi:hypothetical protein GCM10011348_21620 [Marinobacterium nitratireducens]|uniref:UPF0391 membrane protein GCM10011348_21620 n=2 Tax=Marinobacterium nitratireducens TaxID=518897 RepID=A0A918DTT3_9GAMM|nr:hypothetical protein GCM10011348_21620 [Marinobacterium nitratireducens]
MKARPQTGPLPGRCACQRPDNERICLGIDIKGALQTARSVQSVKAVRNGGESSHNHARSLIQVLPHESHNGRERQMLYFAVLFFIVAVVAGLLGFTGVAAGAVEIIRILFVVFVVLFFVSLIKGLKHRR